MMLDEIGSGGVRQTYIVSYVVFFMVI